MAHNFASSFGTCNFTKTPFASLISHKSSNRRSYALKAAKTVTASNNNISTHQPIVRRYADYKPPTWDFEFVQSLNTPFLGAAYTRRISKLKEEVKMMFNEVKMNHLDQLELIDTLQRLGLGYHFEDEINTSLISIFNDNKWMKEDLYATALQFRLLRQHGFHAPQEVFNNFKDNQGNFKANLVVNMEGMVSLYEASYLICEESESILEDARIFSTNHLKNYVQKNNNKEDDYISMLIKHALELPLHWRLPRLESRWYIDVYQKRLCMSPLLLELAKLDFNCVQAVHQQDLKYAARWWEETGLGEKLRFARNRLVQNFLWTVGSCFEAEYGYGRRMGSKVNSLITVIDDIYDVYGTLDELELFTAAIERWEVNTIEQLPDYMKITFLVLCNFVNQMGLDSIREKGFNAIPYLRKAWAELCKLYLKETKWYSSGYIPTLKEYLDSTWISIGGPTIQLHQYFFVSNPITIEGLKCFQDYPHIIHASSVILRLAKDLGTSSDEMKRGDVPKSVQCYINENGVSEEEAREHIKSLIRKEWMKINKEIVGNLNYPFSETFIRIAINVGRTGLCMYEFGDGHAVEDPKTKTKDRIHSLFLHPIPM